MESITLGLSSKAPPSVTRLGGIYNNVRSRDHILHLSSGCAVSFPLLALRSRKPFCPLEKRVAYIVCGEANKESRGSRGGAKGKVAATLALACAVGLGIILTRRNDIAMAAQSPVAAVSPLGGKAALKSLLDVPKQMSSAKAEPFQTKFELPYSPSMAQVSAIKMHAVKLMSRGEAEASVKFLRGAYYVYTERKDNEPAYHVGMALVEILICQGKYQEALECSCLNDNQRLPSDARFPLYKAIIFTMLDNEVEGRRWWEQYIEGVEQGIPIQPPE